MWKMKRLVCPWWRGLPDDDERYQHLISDLSLRARINWQYYRWIRIIHSCTCFQQKDTTVYAPK